LVGQNPSDLSDRRPHSVGSSSSRPASSTTAPSLRGRSRAWGAGALSAPPALRGRPGGHRSRSAAADNGKSPGTALRALAPSRVAMAEWA
jgi:hypothetical protein